MQRLGDLPTHDRGDVPLTRTIVIAAVVLASVPLVVGCGRKTEAQAAASSFGNDAPAQPLFGHESVRHVRCFIRDREGVDLRMALRERVERRHVPAAGRAGGEEERDGGEFAAQRDDVAVAHDLG